MTLKLNIGAGDVRIDGWTPVDRKIGSEAYPLPYDHSSVDEIRASHILEHFTFAEVPKVLEDWVRVLKPGGRIRLAVPDIATLDRRDPKWPFYLMGGQTDADDIHRSCFDEQRLRHVMAEVGLERIEPWQSDNTDSSSLAISLNLQGYKTKYRSVDTDQLVKIAALMSIPRVGFNDHWGCVIDALRPFKIPVRRFIGAFWDQCLQNVMEDCVADGVDWALCLDYDTMFTSEDLDRLMGWFGTKPEIDALAALQARRAGETPLMTIKDTTKVELTGEPIRVDTAHFGLTLIRLECLRDIPKPWFTGQAGPDGSWRHDDRLDPDIWFWHQWRKAGKTVYVAPDVRVGHLELMVREFGDDYKTTYCTVRDWNKRNKP